MNVDDINSISAKATAKYGKAILTSQKALEKSIQRLQKKIIALLAGLESGAGNIKGLQVNFVQSKKIHKQVIALFEKEYNKEVARQIKDFDHITDAVLASFADLGIAAEYTNIDMDVINVLKKSTYEQFKQFGEVAQRRISQGMYDAVIAQSGFDELMDVVTGIMTGHKDVRGRPMLQYAKTYASDSIMVFARSVHMLKAESAGLDHFYYVGTAMQTTRDFCRARIGRVFSREKVESWNTMSWKGKSGNVWTCLGGYNCRHHLQAVREEWLK